MVRLVLALLILAVQLCAQPVLARPLFEVKADRHELVFGDALLLEIRAADAGQPLETLDIGALKRDFDVYAVSTSREVKHQQTVEIMSATLYPLRTGEMEIPALNFMGRTSKAIRLMVQDSGPGVPRVLIKSAIDQTSPVTRQAAVLSLDIYDDGGLQWSPPKPPETTGMHLRPLAETQREETLQGTRFTVHRYAWAAMPLHQGNFDVRFPILEAIKFGKRLRYPVSSIFFMAREVPAYLPVHVPVGKPTVSAQPLPATLAINRPFNRILTVRSASLSQEGLAKLVAATPDTADLRVYAPTVSILPESRTSSAEQVFRVTIPMQFLQTGRHSIPALDLAYYEPASQRIEAVRIPGASVEVVNPAWRSWGVAGAVVAALLSGVWLFVVARSRYRTVRARRAALQRIAQAEQPNELRMAWLAYGAEGVPTNTLGQWRRQGMRSGVHLEDLAQRLDALCYGRGESKELLAAIREELLQALERGDF